MGITISLRVNLVIIILVVSQAQVARLVYKFKAHHQSKSGTHDGKTLLFL